MGDHIGPLAGTKVVEFAGLSPVSVAGMLLRSMGAEVVRVDRAEHPADGPDNSLRRGRKSVVLDLKSSDGLEAAADLVEWADILIEGYRPGVMERLGLGPDDAFSWNPRLIYGRLTGWGQSGPYAQMAGHDITYLALTGALHAMGPSGAPPVPPLNAVADLGGGTMMLLVGVLAALHERAGSGQGQIVDAAMIDGVPTMTATVLRALSQGEWREERATNYLDGAAPFYRCYECKDGGFIAVGAIEPHFYTKFLTAIGLREDELPDQWDVLSWPQLAERIAERILSRTRAEWEETFEGSDACASPVLNFREAAEHPHVKARKAFVEIDGFLQPGVAPRLSRTPLTDPGVPPLRGKHTNEVLAMLANSRRTTRSAT